MRHLTAAVFSLLILSAVHGQGTPQRLWYSDILLGQVHLIDNAAISGYSNEVVLVGRASYRPSQNADWVSIGYMEQSPWFYYGQVQWFMGDIAQAFEAFDDTTGHVMARIYLADDKALWDHFSANGFFAIGGDTLHFSDAYNVFRPNLDTGIGEMETCGLLNDGTEHIFSTTSFCWPGREVLFVTDDIVNVELHATPPPAPPVTPDRVWAYTTNEAGVVVLQWRVTENTNHDAEYEYKVLRDGQKQWVRIPSSEVIINSYDRLEFTLRGLDRHGVYSFCIRAVNALGASYERCNLEKVYPVSTEDGELPTETDLAQNYPNPFNPSTTITYTLDRPGTVELSVYDLTGRVVSTLVDGIQPAGSHEVRFSADNLPTGTYLYRLRSERETLTQTMTLIY